MTRLSEDVGVEYGIGICSPEHDIYMFHFFRKDIFDMILSKDAGMPKAITFFEESLYLSSSNTGEDVFDVSFKITLEYVKKLCLYQIILSVGDL